MKGYFRNILMWMTQTVSVFTGGDEDETVSSRVGKAARDKHWFGLFMARIIDGIFGKDHCLNAIEEDEGKNRIFKY